jgi:uncharacterized membrane protein
VLIGVQHLLLCIIQLVYWNKIEFSLLRIFKLKDSSMNRKSIAWILVLLLIAISFVYALYLYPDLPEKIPTHFNAKGEPDAYGGKNSIYLGPAIMSIAGLLLFALLTNLKSIDPKRYQQQDDGLFWKFGLFMVAFLSCLSMGILYITAHPSVSIQKFIIPTIGLAFAGIGWFMPKFRQNYFAGLRLPWTLDNADNWNATHQLAGKIWMIGGVAAALSGLVFTSETAFIVFFGIILLMVTIPIVFSYRMFRNGNKL